MEQELKERVIRKIEKLLEKRTAGIMEANRRNYYGECAAYIAALGEVKESLGDNSLIWSFYAYGYGEICAAKHHCKRCPIINNCLYIGILTEVCNEYL